MNHRRIAIGLVCVLGGCLDGAEPAPAAADEPMIERTIVRLLPDGSEQVTTAQVSATQQRQELADRAQRLAGATRVPDGTGEVQQGLASVDGGCATSSMWIFDNTGNAVGTWPLNHEICFYKSSTGFPICTDLRQYTRQCFFFGGSITCQNWANDTSDWIGSYWAGRDTGMYLDQYGGAVEGFDPYFRNDNTQLTMPTAVYLCFPNPGQ